MARVLADNIALSLLSILIVWVPLPLFLVVVHSLIVHTTGRLRVIPLFFKVVIPLVPVPAQVHPLYWGPYRQGLKAVLFALKGPDRAVLFPIGCIYISLPLYKALYKAL